MSSLSESAYVYYGPLAPLSFFHSSFYRYSIPSDGHLPFSDAPASKFSRSNSIPLNFNSQTTLLSPPSTRTILPAITYLCFKGWCTYLEDLVASIDAPLLDTMFLSFFEQDTYNTPQLSKFISCTNQLRSPRLGDLTPGSRPAPFIPGPTLPIFVFPLDSGTPRHPPGSIS